MADVATDDTITKQALEQVKAGADLAAVLKVLAPAPPAPEVPEHLPLPAQITASQREALLRLSVVYGKVVPVERRTLEPSEVAELIDERVTLDEIEKMAKDRKDDIRTTVFNHLDVEAESSGEANGADRDDRGHYVLKGEARAPGSEYRFTREVRGGSPVLDAEALRALEDEGVLDHEDYLAMTSQVRVVDEHKVMLLLKSKPHLVDVIRRATQPGRKSAALYKRKA